MRGGGEEWPEEKRRVCEGGEGRETCLMYLPVCIERYEQ